jgi:CheY-like chemotaxis protein
VSKSIIELHGGDIGCTSCGTGEAARGSLFFFELPISSVKGDMSRGPSSGLKFSMELETNLPTPSDSTTNKGLESNKVAPAPSAMLEAVVEYNSYGGSSTNRSPRRSLWTDHERLLSGKNAIMASSFDMHGDEPTTTEVVIGADSVTASAGARRNNSILARKAVSLNVMVVDDAPLGRKMMTRALKSVENSKSALLMIKVHEGADGADAIAMIAKAARSRHAAVADDNPEKSRVFYDLVFIDSEMTSVSGPDAIREIRNTYRYRGVIYGVTGHATTESHLAMMEAGATGVFVKPLLVDQLRSVVESYAMSVLPSEMSVSTLMRLGGTMNARSPVSSPSVFPLQSGSSSKSDHSGGMLGLLSMSESSANLTAGATALNVLVVDDTAVQRKIVVRALRSIARSCGIDLAIVEGLDGGDAVTIVEAAAASSPSRRFDLIFMDYDMPVLDGAAAMKIIREKLGHVGPMYAVTANENASEHEKLRAAGATKIFIKPIEFDQLRTIVEGMRPWQTCVCVAV